jgi:capsular exopolysaccharide synthesis family protein
LTMGDVPEPSQTGVERYDPAQPFRGAVSDTPPVASEGTATSGETKRSSLELAAAIRAAQVELARLLSQFSPRRSVRSLDRAQDQTHLVSLLQPHSLVAEQYRALRHVVEQEHRSGNLSTLAVSSPSMGDGKTTTLINLAGALAQTPDVRVLLVDADLRRPTLATRLGMKGEKGPADPGLLEAILDETLTLDDVVTRHPEFNLYLLSPGLGSGSPYETLRAQRLGKLLDEARRQYHYVLVDTPPLVPLADCRLIAKWVDKFILVVTAHRTRRKLLEESLRILPADKVLGLVFNGDDQPVPRSYYDCAAYGAFNGNHWAARWPKQLEVLGAMLRRQTAGKARLRQ